MTPEGDAGESKWLPPRASRPAPDLGPPPPPSPLSEPPAATPPDPATPPTAPTAAVTPPHPAVASSLSPPEPDNGPAVASFVIALSGLGAFVISFGLLFFASLPCGIAAIALGVRGARRVQRGETARHHGLARWGTILGIVTVVLSLLGAAAWIAVVGAAEDLLPRLEELQRDLGRPAPQPPSEAPREI